MSSERVKSLAPRTAKEAFRHAARAYGTATARFRPLPDYLIIGAKRGGTTSLWNNLMQHPQIVPMFPSVENLKSPHYFDINWTRSEAWYRSYFPTSRSRARQGSPHQGGGTAETLTGEASPYYMFHPLAAARAAETVPRARILVLLRNPVDRALSHYNERVKAGTETLTFREALEAESGRLAGEEERIVADPAYYSERHDFCSYLARGHYLSLLNPWLEHFGRANVFVGRSEDLYENPRGLLSEVFAFLGLPPVEVEQPRHFNKLSTSPMDPADRTWLAGHYEDSVQALQDALDRDFGWQLR